MQTLVLAGQRAAARAGVPAGGFREVRLYVKCVFISQLQDMISKIRARLYPRLNELYTPHAAQTTGGARRVREVVPTRTGWFFIFKGPARQ